ncbi:MAG: XRE family transcriptional regulator [Bacillota bacterium]|nr:XRE family transcriptional regulator [Bacillota bacterium]
MNFGEKIKDLRLAQGLTQEELAQRCELTKGFISQVENNLASPSITSFIDILDALGTSPSKFFDDKEEKIVFKDEEFSEYVDEENGYVINWLVPNSQKNHMEPTLIEIQPGGSSLDLDPFDGEEFGYVIEGQIDLIYGNKTFKVQSGQSFYFSAKKNHKLVNKGKKAAKIIWISSPPSF